jgi:hypothetical protein
MRITESRLRSLIRRILKENLDVASENVNVHGIEFKDLKVHVDHQDMSEVGVEYEINGKEYLHENDTGSYEGLAYAIMDNLVVLKKVDEESDVYEEVENFLIDLLDDKIFKRREEIYKRLEDLE